MLKRHKRNLKIFNVLPFYTVKTLNLFSRISNCLSCISKKKYIVKNLLSFIKKNCLEIFRLIYRCSNICNITMEN